VLIDFKALHEEADALADEGRHDGPFFLAAILRHRSSQMSLQSIKRSASVVSVQAKDQQHHVFAHSHAQHVDFLKDSRFSRTMFHPGGTHVLRKKSYGHPRLLRRGTEALCARSWESTLLCGD
jgi:hypothetical protein